MLLVKEHNLTVNSPSMPLKSPEGIYDTSEMYKKENVSYGNAHTRILSDGKLITFAANRLTGVLKLDERNLRYCKYLNL